MSALWWGLTAPGFDETKYEKNIISLIASLLYMYIDLGEDSGEAS